MFSAIHISEIPQILKILRWFSLYQRKGNFLKGVSHIFTVSAFYTFKELMESIPGRFKIMKSDKI